MNISSSSEARAEKIKVTEDTLIVHLVDGRKLEVPLGWFPRLCKATATQRKQYQFIGSGIGIHWRKIDEDISVEGLLNASAYPLTFQTSEKRNQLAA